MIEVDRPNRQERRRNGKSDQLDAIEAARGALSGRVGGLAKTGTGNVEALRALLVTKRSARSMRISAVVRLRHLMFTAPDELRQRLAPLSVKRWSPRPPDCAHTPTGIPCCLPPRPPP